MNLEKNNNTKIDNEIIDNNLLDIKDILNILIRRKKIILLTTSLFFSISIINLVYRRITNPQYLGTFSIMTRDPIIEKKRGTSGSEIIEELAVNNTYSDIPTLIQYLKSEKVISRTATLNNLSPFILRNKIKIAVPRNPDVQGFLPNILKVNVIGPDKIKLNRIINSLSEDYIKIAADSKREKLIDGINFLKKERPVLERRANNLQDELETFRLANKLINPLNDAEKLTARIEQTRNNILNLKSENVRLSFIKDNLSDGILFTEGIYNQSENSGLNIMGAEQLLLQEILDVKSALAKAQSTYKKTSTVVLNLKAKLNQLEPILLENQKSAVNAAIIVNEGKIKSSENELSKLEEQFTYLPNLINKYSKIISKQKLIEQNLEYLLSAGEKLELELSQGTLPWKLISKPFVNPRPFKPEIKINLLYGLLISLSIGLLLGLILDKIDNVFHSPDEIEKDSILPALLGFIPFFKISSNKNGVNSKDFLTINSFLKSSSDDKELNFTFEETFRNIYTSIKFSKIDKELKTIGITSSIPSEGKSLTSVLLGLNISEFDKKVLVIDADLRRPSLHKKFEVDNVAGLSNILVDNDYKWQDAINQFETNKNLFYITGGKTPPNPVKLLNSEKMKNLIKEICNSNDFDLIIFDCPPIVGLSDALIISELIDGVILTISLNNVNQQIVKDALRQLSTSTNEILGVFANNIKEELNTELSISKYYYQYKYQSKYLSLENKASDSKNELSNGQIPKKKINEKFIIRTLKKLKSLKQTFIDWINE